MKSQTYPDEINLLLSLMISCLNSFKSSNEILGAILSNTARLGNEIHIVQRTEKMCEIIKSNFQFFTCKEQKKHTD